MTQKYKKFLIKTTKTVTKLIHSHNVMKAYFSGTDMSEINDNSEFHNYYLSIVVNNALDIVGKIGFRGKINNPIGYDCKTGDGKAYTLKINTDREILFVYDCEIKTKLFDVSDSFVASVNKIIEKAKKMFVNKPIGNTNLNTPIKGFGKSILDKNKQLPQNTPNFQNHPFYTEELLDDFEDDGLIDWIDDFPPYWLSFGELGSENFTEEEAIERVVEQIKIAGIYRYTTDLLANSTSIYKRYFKGSLEEVTEYEAFKHVFAIYSEYVKEYPLLEHLLENLELFIRKLEKDGNK
jgi:hypothetical protein